MRLRHGRAAAFDWKTGGRGMNEIADQTSQIIKEDDGLSASAKDIARDQWSNVVRTQIHFNEIIHRTRQLTVTVIAAAFGAAIASFAAKPAGHLTLEAFSVNVPIATPLVILGLIFLAVGFLMDRSYYYKLLLGAVEVGEHLETTYDLPAKLTITLSKAVSRRRANIIINLFYIGGLLIGGILLLVLTIGGLKDIWSQEIV
jgi:hypothetical protein